LLALKNKHVIKGYWALAAISFFWGTTWFIAKKAVNDYHIPPLQLTGIRQTLAGISLILFFIFRTKKLPTVQELKFHFICGFLLIACSNGLTTWGIQYIPSFLGALIGCLMPFVLIIGSAIFYKEKIKPMVILSLVFGFIGVALLLSSFAEEFKSPHFILGIILSLIGVVTWTSGTLITAKNKLNINPIEGIGWQMLIGGILLLFASLLSGQHVPLQSIAMEGWILLIYLTIFGSIVAFVCYLYALKQLPLSLVSIYVYINPIIALLMGMIFLHEKINALMCIGIVVILISIYLVKRFTNKVA